MATKITRIGTQKDYRGTEYSVYVKIEWYGGRLSITGVEGPKRYGNAHGSAGQIVDDITNVSPAQISMGEIQLLQSYWKEWHLNDMQSACEHQRALNWTYETHKGQNCPVCGYQIGSAWTRKEVPQNVIDWLFSLPETDVKPAWA